jgi:MFS family permease
LQTHRLYKGWIVLGGLFVLYAITNGVVLNTLPLFYPELIKEFGWTQDVVTRPAQLLFLVVALTSPFIGAFLDKWPIKRLMYIGALLILLGFFIFYKTTSNGTLIIAYMIFSIGITLAGIMPSMKIITQWFLKNRGLAVGLLLVGSSMGGAIFNPIAGKLIAEYGWKSGVLILGIISFFIVILPLIFFIQETPESAGVNRSVEFDVNTDTSSNHSNHGLISYASVLSSKLFYILLFITGAMWFCIVGIIQHQALFIKDLNLGISSANVLGIFFICSVLGKILFGKLSDRYAKKKIMLLAVCNLALGAAILTLLKVNPNVLLYVYAIVFGIGFSGTFTMIQLVIADCYQGPSYGKILGLFTMIDTLAGVLGIMTLGKLRTTYGSYDNGFCVLLILCIISAVCVLFIPNSQKND